jgi:hypothetical protein
MWGGKGRVVSRHIHLVGAVREPPYRFANRPEDIEPH